MHPPAPDNGAMSEVRGLIHKQYGRLALLAIDENGPKPGLFLQETSKFYA